MQTKNRSNARLQNLALSFWGPFAIRRDKSSREGHRLQLRSPPLRPIGNNDIWAPGGSGGIPQLVRRRRDFFFNVALLLTKKHRAACVLPYLIACAVYTRAHFTSTSRARFSSVPFAACVPWVRPHWGVPTKQRCDHGPPQARLSAVCVCVLCSKKGADCLHRIWRRGPAPRPLLCRQEHSS